MAQPSSMSTAAAPPAPGLVARLVGKPWVWLIVVLGLASLPLTQMVVRDDVPAPEVLGQVPNFALVDQQGKPFGTADLSGRVWIANFIFTRCPTVCPIFTQKMARLQDRLGQTGPAVHLVSFSVDPDYDTPAVLAEYAATYRANPRLWSFLTGAPDDVRATVRDGLKIAMERRGIDGDVPDILHGTHFVLVDQRQAIRGYYDSNDASALEQLLRDINYLLNVRE
jgi:protein SCO1